MYKFEWRYNKLIRSFICYEMFDFSIFLLTNRKNCFHDKNLNIFNSKTFV